MIAIMGQAQIGDIVTYQSDSGWRRQLKVIAIDGDNITYEPVDDDDD